MKKIAKGLIGIIVLLILAGGGGVFYLTRNMEAAKDIVLRGVKPESMQDGVYMGNCQLGRFSNKLDVILEGNKIVKINIIKDVTFSKPEVSKQIFIKVIAAQNTTVDTVSGATLTSNAYLSAVENALNQKSNK